MKLFKEKYLLTIMAMCLLSVRGEGFFAKLMNRGRNDLNGNTEDYEDVCKTVKVMPRIAMAVVGGAPLKSENSAPYIAAVGERLSNGSVSWFCGGSLIAAHDILTAAHCLVSRNVTTVRLGSFSTKIRSTENDYEISKTIIHPDYKITQSYNDIAVIKLKKKVSYSINVKPVCLPQDDSDRYEKEKAKVIGWGAEEFGGEGTQKLQQVEVEVFTNPNCEKSYKNSTIAPKTFPKGITKDQLCAGSPKGGKDACQGDSGGPLVLTDGNGIVRQIGIVSTGAGCGSKMYPGVYARVSSYTNWIQKQIDKIVSTSHGAKDTNHDSRESTTVRTSQSTGRPNAGASNHRLDTYSLNKEVTNSKERESTNYRTEKTVGYNEPTGNFHIRQNHRSSEVKN